MDPQATSERASGNSLGKLLGSCALLGLALIPAGILAGWLCSPRFDRLAVMAASIAVAVCWVSGSLALAATWLGNAYRSPVQGLLIGMLMRMGLPLAAGLALDRLGGPLAEARVFSMIVGVYLCGLVVETALSLRFIPSAAPALKAAPR